MPRILAFDLETTGVEPESDRIVEFCFIELTTGLEERARWTEMVHPMVPIPAAVVRIHGITDEMVADKRPFSAYAARIQRLVGKGPEDDGPAVLIGHNVRFDVRFLHHELQRAGLPGLRVDHPTIDTNYLESIIHPKNLSAMYERYTGKALDDAHRSEADTAATVDVLRAQLARHGGTAIPAELHELESSALARKRDPESAITWLDHGHRFYEDAKGVTRFGFGKHRHKRADSVLDYLEWMRRQDFPADVVTIIDEILYQVRAEAPA